MPNEAAPTPPAQEDEPVGYVSQYSLALLADNECSVDIDVWKQRDAVSPHAIYTRPDSELRKAVRLMASTLKSGEWAEHVDDSDPDVAALERVITRLVGEINGLRKAGEIVIESFKESEQMMWSGALINLRAALNKGKP